MLRGSYLLWLLAAVICPAGRPQTGDGPTGSPSADAGVRCTKASGRSEEPPSPPRDMEGGR